MKRFIVVAILICYSASAWGRVECEWHETEGSAFADNVSPQEAWKLAVSRAAFTAVEQEAGVSISGASLVKDSVLVTDIVTSLSEGFIVSKETVQWKESFHKSSAAEPGIPSYTVKLRSCVSNQSVGDPFFTIVLSTNKGVYYNGEKIVLNARPSRESYITFFSVSDDERVRLLQSDGSPTRLCVKEAESCSFPPAGFGLRATVPTGKKKNIESFIAVATREWFDFTGAFRGQKEVDLAAFFAIVSKLPSKSRAMGIAPYEVRAQ